MVQRVKSLAAKPEHMNSIPRNHLVGEENRLQKVVHSLAQVQ